MFENTLYFVDFTIWLLPEHNVLCQWVQNSKFGPITTTLVMGCITASVVKTELWPQVLMNMQALDGLYTEAALSTASQDCWSIFWNLGLWVTPQHNPDYFGLSHSQLGFWNLGFQIVVISQTHWLVSQERLSLRAGTSIFIDLFPVMPSGEQWFLQLVCHTTLLPHQGMLASTDNFKHSEYFYNN